MDTPNAPQKGDKIEYRSSHKDVQSVRGTVREVRDGKVYCNWDDGLFNIIPAPLSEVVILKRGTR